MGKKIDLTDADIQQIKDIYETNHDPTDVANLIGCCVDTAKRILMRHSIAFFEGAKYVTSEQSRVKKWTRPCMRCKCTEPRPMWQYFCDKCKRNFDNYDEDYI